MHVSEIETPAIVVDLAIMERNIQRVASYARKHSLRLRPHTKTHKSPELGRLQLQAGADGLTVAKVGEAEVMLRSGVSDLLVAYPIVGPQKLRRLMDVAERVSVTVALDSVEVATGLSEAARRAGRTIDVLVEQDIGLGRVGLRDDADLLNLAKAVDQLPGLRLRGFNFYPGHIKTVDSNDLAKLDAVNSHLETTVQAWRSVGLPLEIISGGSTPTLFESHRLTSMNEIRPGTYIFNDRNTLAAKACSVEDCAAYIVVTVVSTNRVEGLVVDGGSKTFSSDSMLIDGKPTFGLVRESEDAVFVKMNEEHGYINMPEGKDRFRVGDRLHILPNHICVAVNLHQRVYGIRGDQVESIWEVEGRGKLQ